MSDKFCFPVARWVGGSLTSGKTHDEKNQPYMHRDGVTPMTKYSFGIAIPKDGRDWRQTEWGAQIVAEAQKGFPQGQHLNPQFAWKVTDGDSQVPNKNGNKPCDNEGWPGHWVLWFSGTSLPAGCLVTADGSAAILDASGVKPGHWLQVYGDVSANGSQQSPGVFLNYTYIAHSGFGPEIKLSSAPAANTVGFGQSPLPPGASATPVTQMAPPAAAGAPVTAPAPSAAPTAPSAPNTSYMAPPPPVQKPWPVPGWTQHLENPAYWYMGNECITEAELRAR